VRRACANSCDKRAHEAPLRCASCERRLCSGESEQIRLVDLREVVPERLHDSTLTFRLLFEVIPMLGEQIPDGVCWLEVQRQPAFGGEDLQEHLDTLPLQRWVSSVR
jgi:hypothetical protein